LQAVIPVTSTDEQTRIMCNSEQFGFHFQAWGKWTTDPSLGSVTNQKIPTC
jgi:hypothetical protein